MRASSGLSLEQRLLPRDGAAPRRSTPAIPARMRAKTCAAQRRVGHQLGVARGDGDVALGQHHVHVRRAGCGRTATRRASPAGVAMPSLGRAASHALTAAPKPYQPGSISRHCAQLNTQGIARRSSMRLRLRARGRAAADVELGDLVRAPWTRGSSGRSPRSRRPARDRRGNACADSSSMTAMIVGRRRRPVSRVEQRRLERSRRPGSRGCAGRPRRWSTCRRSPRPAR